MRGRAPWVAVLVLAILIAPAALAQCSMCRGALESPEGARLAWAFRHAILFLLAAPFVAVVVIAVLAARTVRLGAADRPAVDDLIEVFRHAVPDLAVTAELGHALGDPGVQDLAVGRGAPVAQRDQ